MTTTWNWDQDTVSSKFIGSKSHNAGGKIHKIYFGLYKKQLPVFYFNVQPQIPIKSDTHENNLIWYTIFQSFKSLLHLYIFLDSIEVGCTS
mgnify:CR=1 FL=1